MSNEELVVPDSLLGVSAAAHQSEQKVVFCWWWWWWGGGRVRVYECAGDRYRQSVSVGLGPVYTSTTLRATAHVTLICALYFLSWTLALSTAVSMYYLKY